MSTHHHSLSPLPLPLFLLQVWEAEVGAEACRLATSRSSLRVGRKTREVLSKLNLQCRLGIGRCRTDCSLSLECWERAQSLIHARNSDSRLQVDLIILVCWNRNHNWTARLRYFIAIEESFPRFAIPYVNRDSACSQRLSRPFIEQN